MSSTKPVRQSARQSAIRQQELEAEQEAMRQKAIRDEARKEKARQEAALREELALQEKLLQEQVKREEKESRSSSRSLSPALSGSSLSSDDDDDSIKQEDDEEEDDDEDEDQTNGDLAVNEVPTDGSDLRSNSTVALIYGFLTKFRSLLRLTCPLREVTIDVSLASSTMPWIDRLNLPPKQTNYPHITNMKPLCCLRQTTPFFRKLNQD